MLCKFSKTQTCSLYEIMHSFILRFLCLLHYLWCAMILVLAVILNEYVGGCGYVLCCLLMILWISDMYCVWVNYKLRLLFEVNPYRLGTIRRNRRNIRYNQT